MLRCVRLRLLGDGGPERRRSLLFRDLASESGQSSCLCGFVGRPTGCVDRIVIYSGTISPQSVAIALELGVPGVVLKGSPPTELSAAIRTVAAGGIHVDPRIAG
jgi:DNA-binding NarL/FixJ family response regulator